jgi:hypothetical protein
MRVGVSAHKALATTLERSSGMAFQVTFEDKAIGQCRTIAKE